MVFVACLDLFTDLLLCLEFVEIASQMFITPDCQLNEPKLNEVRLGGNTVNFLA